MRFMQHRGAETQMAGALATFALAAEQFPLVPLPERRWRKWK